MSQFIDQFLEVLKDINDSEDFFNEFGKMMWNMHQGLIKAGFTEEQSLKILESMDSPIKSS